MTTLTTRADKGSALTHNEMDTNLQIAVPDTSVKTTNYTVVVGDEGDLILVDTSSGAVTITLPAAATAGDGFGIRIKVVDATNLVTIDANASETIDGALTLVLSRLYESVYLICDGSNWHIAGTPKESYYAELSLGKSTNNSTATTMTALDTYYATGGTWTEETSYGMTTTVGSGIIAVPVDGDYLVHADLSFITNGTNETVSFRFMVGGTATGPRIRREVQGAGDVGHVSISTLLTGLSSADQIQVSIAMLTGEGGTAGDTVTVENAIFSARKFG